MIEKKTCELDSILKSATLETFDSYNSCELESALPKLSEYLNEYIGSRSLSVPDIIRASLLSADYAYAILNGNKANPNRDRIIALCMAMKMSLDEVQRTLKLANAGILYSKNPRDAIITIFINTENYDIMKLNEYLSDRNQKILETSKEAKHT